MTMYHKIWIEVDVEKDVAKKEKTAKIRAIMDALDEVRCIVNITKVQYKVPIQEDQKP